MATKKEIGSKKPGTHPTGARKESVKRQGEPHSRGSFSSKQRALLARERKS